jgi:hypothetical protein
MFIREICLTFETWLARLGLNFTAFGRDRMSILFVSAFLIFSTEALSGGGKSPQVSEDEKNYIPIRPPSTSLSKNFTKLWTLSWFTSL